VSQSRSTHSEVRSEEVRKLLEAATILNGVNVSDLTETSRKQIRARLGPSSSAASNVALVKAHERLEKEGLPWVLGRCFYTTQRSED
jgi:hypothetical protein